MQGGVPHGNALGTGRAEDKKAHDRDRSSAHRPESLAGAGGSPVYWRQNPELARARSPERMVFLHRHSRTLSLTDTAFLFDTSFPWLTQAVAALGGSYNCLRPSLLERLATVDPVEVKASVEQILRWDFERVIVAHGSVVNEGGKVRLKRGYEAFLGCSLSL